MLDACLARRRKLMRSFSQGVVKGYVLHSKGIVVLKKGTYFGFEPLNMAT